MYKVLKKLEELVGIEKIDSQKRAEIWIVPVWRDLLVMNHRAAFKENWITIIPNVALCEEL